MICRFSLLISSLVFLIACSRKLPADVAEAYKTVPEEIDFNQHVKPILSDRCFSCHGPDKGIQEAGLRLDVAESAYAELPQSPGRHAIVPGKLDKSELVKRILSTDPEEMMPAPKSHLTLNAYEKAVLVKWVEQGGKYKPHWAFIKPENPTIPGVQQKAWVKNPIDHFILNRLETKKLSPSPESDKETLLRRVSLDLTGLPPTVPEIDAFLSRTSRNQKGKNSIFLYCGTTYSKI